MTDGGPIPLPENPSLDWLKGEAKRRLQRLREQDPAARLADAQFALARSHGFSSWRALKAHIDAASDHAGQAVVRLSITTDEIYGVAFSPDLSRVLTGSEATPSSCGTPEGDGF
jgi:hypothetical protein